MSWFYNVLFIVLSIGCGYFVFRSVTYFWQAYRQGRELLRDDVDVQSLIFMLGFLIMGGLLFLAGIGVYDPGIVPQRS